MYSISPQTHIHIHTLWVQLVTALHWLTKKNTTGDSSISKSVSLTTTWHTSPRKPLQKKPDPADPIIETMNHVDGDFYFCKYFSYLKYCTIFILFRRVSQLKRKKLLKRSALQLAWLTVWRTILYTWHILDL